MPIWHKRLRVLHKSIWVEREGRNELCAHSSKIHLLRSLLNHMQLNVQFDICGGSVTGFSHLDDDSKTVAIGNQDAFRFGFDESGRYAVGVVSDGCSSGCDSKTGARLISKWVIEAVKQEMSQTDPTPHSVKEKVVEQLRDGIRGYIRLVATNQGDPHESAKIIHQTFFATAIFFVVTPTWTAIFGAGDGIYAINSTVSVLSAPKSNTPKYFAYSCLSEKYAKDYKDASIEILSVMDTDRLESLMIGTDGLEDLVDSKSKSALEALWKDPALSASQEALGNYLLSQQAVSDREWEEIKPGNLTRKSRSIFADDATTVVLRLSSKSQQSCPAPPAIAMSPTSQNVEPSRSAVSAATNGVLSATPPARSPRWFKAFLNRIRVTVTLPWRSNRAATRFNTTRHEKITPTERPK